MRQHGYTSAWMLPVIAALLALTVGVMSVSQQVRSTWYEQNVADNMALSAATLMARELNLLALINRALLANQLTLAQLSGVYSWYLMMQDVAERSALAATWIPYLNAITRQISQAVRHVERPLTTLLRGAVYVQQAMNTALRATQWFARVTFSLEIPRSLTNVANLHRLQEPRWQVLHAPGLVPVPWLWWSYIPPQHSGADGGLAKQLMLASLDGFSRRRSYRWFTALQVSVRKAGGARLQVDKRGAWHWQSMDTVAVHLAGLLDSEELPWGDGLGYNGSKVKSYRPQEFGDSGQINPTTTKWARAQQHRLSSIAERFSYFNRAELQPDDWPQVIVTLNGVTAKAGVFFSRPTQLFPRSDKQPEQANLFNALWEPRLMSLSVSEKVLLASLPGGSRND